MGGGGSGTASPDAPRRPASFLALYALANAGGVLGYVPLLSLLLPLKVEAMAPSDRLGLLTVATLAGAVAASLANIAFGALSDRSYAARGTRRGWLVGGLAATMAGYAGIAAAATPAMVVVAVVAYQAALNVLLAPLLAVMADEIPDAQKGIAGGLLIAAIPAASFAGALLTGFGPPGEPGRLALVCLFVAALVTPLLAAGGIGARPPRRGGIVLPTSGRSTRVDLALIWLSRLCIQVAGNVLFTYLFFYFESVDGHGDRSALASRVGRLIGLAFLIAAPVALAVGRASDRWGWRKPFLLAALAVTAGALALMAAAGSWQVGVVGYGLFAVGSSTFLGLHSAYAMQLLPDPRHRGRDLGIVNLTNTLPALIGPALTWTLATTDRFTPILSALVALTLLGGLAILLVRNRG